MKLFDRNHYALLYSDRCNYRCYYCNNNVPLNAPKSAAERNLDAVIRLFKSLKPGVLFLSGGEPLFWEDAPRLLDSLPDWHCLMFTNLSLVPNWISHPAIKLLIPSFHWEHAKPEVFLKSLTKLRDLGKRAHVKLLVKPGDEYAHVKLWEDIQSLGVPASFTPLGRGFLCKPAFIRDVLSKYRTSCLYNSRFFSSSDTWGTQCVAGTNSAFQINANGEIVRCGSNYDRVGNLLESPERIARIEGTLECAQAAMCCSEWHYFGAMTPANENERWQHYIETGRWQPPSLNDLYSFVMKMDLNPVRRNGQSAAGAGRVHMRSTKPVASLCEQLETGELPSTEAILADFGLTADVAGETAAPVARPLAACLCKVVAEEKPATVLDLSRSLGDTTLSLLHAMSSVELFMALPRMVPQESLGMLFNHFDFAQSRLPNWGLRHHVATERLRVYPVSVVPDVDGQVAEPVPCWHQVPDVVRLLAPQQFDLVFTDQAQTTEQIAAVISQFWPFVAPGGLVLCTGLFATQTDMVQQPTTTEIAESCRQALACVASEVAESIVWVSAENAVVDTKAQPALFVRKKVEAASSSPDLNSSGAVVFTNGYIDHLASLGLDLAGRTVIDASSSDCGLRHFFGQLGCSVQTMEVPQKIAQQGPCEVVTCYESQAWMQESAVLIAQLAPLACQLLVLEATTTATAPHLNREGLLNELRKHFPHAYLALKSPVMSSESALPIADRQVFVASRKPLALSSLTESIPASYPPLEPVFAPATPELAAAESCAPVPSAFSALDLNGGFERESLRAQMQTDVQGLVRIAEVNIYERRKGDEFVVADGCLTFTPRSPKDHIATPFVKLDPALGATGGWGLLEMEFPKSPDPKSKRCVVVVQRENFQELIVVPVEPETQVQTLVQLFANTISFRLVFLSRGNQRCLLPHRISFSQILPLRNPSVKQPGHIKTGPPSVTAEALELAITDLCNLKCNLCSQGTPLQKNKKVMSPEYLRRISGLFSPNEFREIKLSGGEPTLHPEFRAIAKEVRHLFPASRYVLATNGFRLENYLDVIGCFENVDLSEYPQANEELCSRLRALDLPNLVGGTKRESVEMLDVNLQKNHGKHGIFALCDYAKVKKVVQDRIYPCCVAFGLAVRRGIDPATVSVPLDANWRENLAALNIEPHCQRCFIDVDVPVNQMDDSLREAAANLESEIAEKAALLLDVGSAAAFARLPRALYAQPPQEELVWDGPALVFYPSTDRDHYTTDFQEIQFPESAESGWALLEVQFPEGGQQKRIIVGLQDQRYTSLGKAQDCRQRSVIRFSRHSNALRLLFLTPEGKPCMFPVSARLSIAFR